MGIKNIEDLIKTERTEENSVTFDRHKYLPYPNRYKTCVRCGKPEDHQVHIKEKEDKDG